MQHKRWRDWPDIGGPGGPSCCKDDSGACNLEQPCLEGAQGMGGDQLWAYPGVIRLRGWRQGLYTEQPSVTAVARQEQGP